MKNKEFKLIKDGYIFEFNYNFGHINVDIVLRLEWELYFQTNKALNQNVMNG